MAASTIVSRRATEDKQARRERRTASPRLLSSHGLRGSISHPHRINRPATRQEHNETHDETKQSNTQDDGATQNETTRRRRRTHDDGTIRRRERQARTRRQTRRRTRRTTTRIKASNQEGNDRRTRRTQYPIFLTSRPTPSRRLSLIRQRQIVPRPRAWDERAA